MSSTAARKRKRQERRRDEMSLAARAGGIMRRSFSVRSLAMLGVAAVAVAGAIFLIQLLGGGAESAAIIDPVRNERTQGLGVSASVSQLAPNFEAQDLKGSIIRLSDFQGKPVILNFWATWCPPCVTEMPGLARFYLKYHDQDVIFLSFSGDDPGTIGEKVRPFANSYELPFPVWVMDEAERELLNAGLGINWDGLYPTTFLFARDGSLIQTWEGEVTYEALSEAVDNAAGQQKSQEVKPN